MVAEVACAGPAGLGPPLNSGVWTAPPRKNGTSALATSAGVWNRLFGSLAIILATTAASSAGTSERIRFSGLASIEWCACSSSYRLGASNGGWPASRQ